MIIKSIVLCLSGLLLSGCLSYCVLRVTTVQVSGLVCEKATGIPLSGVTVSIQSEKMLGRNQIETLAFTGKEGIIHGETVNKWGCRRRGLSALLKRDPKIEATIRVERESYHSVELDVRLDKYPGWGSNVSIDLGRVLLTPTSAKNDSVDGGI